MNNYMPFLFIRRSFLYAFMVTILVISLSACGESTSKLDGPAETVSLYKARCIACHGNDLQGKMGPSTNLQHVGKQLSLELITKQIHDGGAVMPAFATKLTPSQIKQLAEWLASKK
ncbi:hypothetical protein Back11_32340 [Paenibacillus baekrokdamisoli]|uniref:Uncharacterized protein n=1 Tax=Paenibacillus baekrokdamisoli TaxID=1712516 RepID=A0A3G9JFZ3_9BACL|nr:cytochrome c [Paenibacillus baekrokdamisoli]MBB3071600.1 cytochrome c551 [Paenibacillus baekrokdamisoli]BBH21889.1 hypothetical protein Back11_32340 [Paenibacillus baekrokdamisoli]